jgi:integrase
VDGVRKCNDVKTGVEVGNPETRKGKRNYKEATEILTRVLSEFKLTNSTEMLDNKNQMFADTVREWMDLQRGLKPASTVAGYQYAANDVILFFTEINPVKTMELTSGMIERYIIWERERRQPEYTGEHKKKCKYKDGSGIENTIMHRTTLIRSVLQYGKREGIVDRNVASTRDSQINLPNPQRHEFPVLNQEEAKQLLQKLKEKALWFVTAVTIALLLGLRRSEIVGLRECDIDWESDSITVCHTVTQQTIDKKNNLSPKPFTKNRKAKILPMVEPIGHLLQDLVQENHRNAEIFGKDYDKTWDGYIFRYADGKLITPNAMTNAFERFIHENQFKDIRLHDLRHSCASILFANDTDLLTIQEILGHAQLTTTITYTHKISEKKSLALTAMSEQLDNNRDGEREEDKN